MRVEVADQERPLASDSAAIRPFCAVATDPGRTRSTAAATWRRDRRAILVPWEAGENWGRAKLAVT